MSLQKWERTIDAGALPEPDPNTTAPDPKHVFESIRATDVERGLWVALIGAAGEDATCSLYVRAPGSTQWFVVGSSVKFNAAEMKVDPFGVGSPSDGFEFALIVSAVTGTPSKFIAGLIGKSSE